MGVNNKQRRAAKQRRRAQQRAAGGPRPASNWPGSAAGPRIDSEDAYGLAELQVAATVRRLTLRQHDDSELLLQAESLLHRLAPIPQHVVALVLRDLLARVASTVTSGGWGPTDLRELVRRRDPRLLAMLATVMRDETVRIETTGDLAAGLGLAALLARAPLLDADAVASRSATGGTVEHPKLAQVRALLAKAESTEYDEEAEALIGKAQELIARYALDRLLDEASAGHERGPTAAVRRLWLDAPYVRAKAALVDEVARANRCRTALAEQHGFSLVVGSAADLGAVELLVTSLLVQANAAMQRHAHSRYGRGNSRTRSFRQSFLLAYAARIGERLQAETNAVASEASPRLLPVLHDHEAKISEAFEAMVPHTVGRASSINSGEGWAAGIAAAELAQLDINQKLMSG